MQSFLRYAKGANYRGFLDSINRISDVTGKSSFYLKMDFMKSFLKYGCGLADYINYGLYNKTDKEKSEYITIKDQDIFFEKVNPSEYKSDFAVKYKFLSTFSKYISRKYIVPTAENKNDVIAFCKEHEFFMEKLVDGIGGSKISKKKSTDIDDFDMYVDYLIENRLFVEEVIEQHKDVAAFAPNSVNTIRVVTSNIGGNARIVYAAMRIGSGADVDNFHAGGMGVSIDMEKGVLKGNAVNKVGEEFVSHPVSGIRFDEYKIPNWDIVINTCLEASHVCKNIHFVGWDVAITPEGVTFVEGNRRPGFDLIQMLSKRGRKDIIDDVNAEYDACYGNNKQKRIC